MNGKFSKIDGESVQRLETFAYNFENPDCMRDFLKKMKLKLMFLTQIK